MTVMEMNELSIPISYEDVTLPWDEISSLQGQPQMASDWLDLRVQSSSIFPTA